MYKYLFTLTLAVLLLFGQSASAAARAWELDTAHSNVFFSIDHIYAKVQGRFNTIAATVHFDPAKLAESRFDFEIKVDSIDTGIDQRDDHLRSPDFFAAATHPLITFRSTGITDAGGGVYQVAGKLAIMGTTHDLVLPLTLAGVKDHPTTPGKQVAGFNGRLSVDRLALGVGDGKFYKMGLIGKEVEVFVTLELLADKQ
jgi:polyisoprenoid-binding protein YceI